MTVKGFDWHGARDRCQIPSPLLLHSLVARYWLPLECAVVASNNNQAGTKAGAARRALGLMRMQPQGHTMTTLPLALSTVRVVRYSPIQPDADNGASKIPVDCLQPTRPHKGKIVHGMGLIIDDKQEVCKKLVEWEKAPPGKGAVLVEVWAPRNRETWELGAWTVEDAERAKRLLHELALAGAGV